MSQPGASVRTITILVMVVVGFFGWALAAAGYAEQVERWQAADGMTGLPVPAPASAHGLAAMLAGFLDFCINAVIQVPNVFSVLGFTFRERVWLPIVVLAVEGLVVFGGFKLQSFEKQLASPRRRR